MSPQPHIAPADAAPVVYPIIGEPLLVIVDTGVIYNDIVYRLRHPQRPTALQRHAAGGAIRLLAADHVFDEIYDRLDGFQRRRITRDEVIACFEGEYLPLIRFADVSALPLHPRAEAVAQRDPSDFATAQLALLCAPAVVLAEDGDLVDHGFGERDWLPLLLELETLMGLDMTLLLSGHALQAGGRRLIAFARETARNTRPTEIALAGALAAAMILAVPALAAGVDRAIRTAGAAAGHVALTTIGGGLGVLRERERHAAAWTAAAVAADEHESSAQRFAHWLAARERAQAEVQARAAHLDAPERAALHGVVVTQPDGMAGLGRHRAAR